MMHRRFVALLPAIVVASIPALAARKEPGPLIAPGPQPQVAILFMGHLRGAIEPCR